MKTFPAHNALTLCPVSAKPPLIAKSVNCGANQVAKYNIPIILIVPLISVFKIFPLCMIVAMQRKKAANAKSAKGKTLFPGSIAARISVIGINNVPIITVVGCPKVIAESKPI